MSNPILGRVEKDAQSGYAGFRDSSAAPQQGYQAPQSDPSADRPQSGDQPQYGQQANYGDQPQYGQQANYGQQPNQGQQPGQQQ